MAAVLVVADVQANEPDEMPFAQDDDMFEHLSAAVPERESRPESQSQGEMATAPTFPPAAARRIVTVGHSYGTAFQPPGQIVEVGQMLGCILRPIGQS